MNKKVIAASVIGLLLIVATIVTGVVLVGKDKKDEPSRITPTKTATQAEDKPEQKVIEALQEKQELAYANGEEAPMPDEVDPYGVYFAQYQGKDIIFTFAYVEQDSDELKGMVYRLGDEGQDSTPVPFADLDEPVLIWSEDDVDTGTNLSVGSVVIDGAYLYMQMGRPFTYSEEDDLAENRVYTVYRFDLITGITDDQIMDMQTMPNRYADVPVLVDAEEGYLVFDVYGCVACDGAFESPTDFIIYNTANQKSKTIEGAGFKGLDVEKGVFYYQNDIAQIYATCAPNSDEVEMGCDVTDYEEQGGEKFEEKLP